MRSEAQPVLKNQHMLCPSDSIDTATGRSTWQQASQEGPRYVLELRNAQWEVCLNEIFGSEILGEEKTQSPQVPKHVWE